jgi:hypothetical protein
MNTCSDISENERQAQDELVALAEGMLGGSLSFFEGSARVVGLWASLGKIEERDKDFDAFAVIASETDHLPLAAAKQLWAAESLERLAPEYERTEQWALGFAPQACKNLVARFQLGSSYPEAPHA